MGDKIKQHRILAVQRFKNGESPESTCTSLGKSKVWLYKWTKRYNGEESSWFFPVSSELKLEYVVATINVKEQKLKLFLDKIQVDELSHKLR